MIEKSKKKNYAGTIFGILILISGIVYYYSNKVKDRNFLGPINTTFENPQKDSAPLIKSTAVVQSLFTEIYPVQIMFLKNTHDGIFEGYIHNSGNDSKNYEIIYKLSELSDPEYEHIHVEPGAYKSFRYTPFSNKLLNIESPIITQLYVKIQEQNGNQILEESYTIKINSADEMPWILDDTDCSYLIASWVTPKNKEVEKLVSKSCKEYGHNVSVAREMTDEEFDDFIKAIFNTVRDEGVSYLNSTISFGSSHSQRVRLPEKSIQYKTANCIDGSVLLASMFENTGLSPYIILIPGHAFVAVARPGKENHKIYLETTLLGRSTMQSILTLETTYSAAKRTALDEYNQAVKKYGNNTKLQIIDIRKCRKDHILPI